VKSSTERHALRSKLARRAALQRRTLASAIAQCRTPLRLADYTYRGIALAKRHPAISVTLLALVLRRLGRSLSLRRTAPRWLARGLMRRLLG
jgi:hypothetical protein